MNKKRVVVLGAGISGLSAAHALMKTHDVILLESANRAGGLLETTYDDGFLFEMGPRTFRTRQSPHLLALVEELRLQDQLLFSDLEAQRRYLFFQGRLELMPTHPLRLLFSPLLKGVRRGLLSEWKKPVFNEEETVWQFATRRLGTKAAERFFDALCLGVYAADSRSLSIEAVFPQLKKLEREHGSITKALFRHLFSKPKTKTHSSLFSFKGGVQVLVDALVERLNDRLYVNHSVEAVVRSQEGYFSIRSGQNHFEADLLVVALPPHEAGRLLESIAPPASAILNGITMTSLSIVQLGYDDEVLTKKGFGYLVPSKEKLPLLGVVFDSSIFPSQNQGRQTRLTVMLPPMKQAAQVALSMVEQHLQIKIKPKYIRERVYHDMIPLPTLGHCQRMAAMQKHLPPNLFVIGNYLNGVSVNDCIATATKLH
jgi:protoporphyrinogen/coproporphyrinogen III oxidase